MSKTRRDNKGRVLQKGETYLANRGLYSYNYVDPIGKRRFIYSVDLLALRDKENDVRRDDMDGIDSYARANCTLNFLFERYIATKKNLRSSTRTNYIYTYERYIKPTIGRRRIGEIKYSDILYFYEMQLENGYKLSTIDSMHRIISSAFKLAVRDDVVRKNPADGVMAEIKASQKDRPVKHALTYKEETEFLKCLDLPANKKWKPLFVFMFGTGCRVSEVIGIRWKDIDFEDNMVKIDHDITYYPRENLDFKCAYEAGPPKTVAGFRSIPLLPKVKKVLLEEKKNQKLYGYCNTAVVDGMSGFIFCNRFGDLYKPSGINKAIRRIVEDHNSAEEVRAAKEDRDPVMIPYFSCHITRHTYCTRLCENETNIKLIQQIMGHADIRTTMDIYAEVTKEKTQSVFQGFNGDDVL